MNFFFDRNVAFRLARMIAGYESSLINVEHHDERFEKTTSDIDWMHAVAQRTEDWAVVSGDGRILRNAAERAVLAESGLTFFLLKSGWLNLPIHDQACKLLKIWPKMTEAATEAREPSVFEIPISAPKVEFIAFTARL